MGRESLGKDVNILWKDRKRWMGQPWSFTRYYLVEKPGSWLKLFISVGLFSVYQEEVNLYRIYDVSVVTTFTNRWFGVGTIVLHCNVDNTPQIRLVRVKDPYKVRDMIADLIEKERTKKGYRVGEFTMGGG